MRLADVPEHQTRSDELAALAGCGVEPSLPLRRFYREGRLTGVLQPWTGLNARFRLFAPFCGGRGAFWRVRAGGWPVSPVPWRGHLGLWEAALTLASDQAAPFQAT
jgi:hypothetical protein